MDTNMNLLDAQIDLIEPPVRAWSDFQTAIFDAVREPQANVLVQAVAGSGKTTTLIEATRYAPGSTLTLAFNRAIVEDYRTRAPSGDVKTLNALGHALWRAYRPEAQLDFKKSAKILEGRMTKQDFRDYGYALGRVLGLAKNNAFGIEGHAEGSPDDFLELIDNYQFDVPAERLADLACVAADALLVSSSDDETFDFDDQLYMPELLGWEYPRYDNVFVDECQDLSPIQHCMLHGLGHSARVVAVGDRFQAIYGFRGALSNSMDELKDGFQMAELPLSISYRCSQRVVEEARSFNPDICWRDGAPLGGVSYLPADNEDPRLFSNAMILCRNNAPLFRAILRHVRAKAPCRVLSNFLDSFQGFIRGFKCSETKELLVKLDRWYERERSAAEAKGFRGKVYALTDRYETVKMLCEEFTVTAEMLEMVRRLGEGTSGPTFATIHKAKGLEHDNVYLLRPDLMPAPYAHTREARQQEANLQYVAITRARENFTYGESYGEDR